MLIGYVRVSTNDQNTALLRRHRKEKYVFAERMDNPHGGDVPPPTKEELMAIAEARKLSLKAQADSEIAWR